MRVQAPPARRGASARRAAQARASAERQAEPVSAAAVGLAAAAAVAAGVEAPTAEAKEVYSYAGLSPCKDSKAFEKREKNEIRSINRKLKKYDEGSAPAIALEKSLKQTENRFQAYRDAGLLCGGDGLPHLIVDGNRQHLGEFVVPGIGFLYISGWIGWAGREYVRENKENSKKPTEGEIIIDVPMALRCMRTALVWPVRAIKELRSGKLLKANVTVSPR
jgi:photosystem I subunit 3